MLRSNFKYNGRSLSDFQMCMYDADDDPQGVVRTIERGAAHEAREAPNHYTTFRSEALVHHFLIIKDPEFFGSSDALRLTEKEIHRLKAWLFSTNTPSELTLPMDDEGIDITYFGVFTDVQYYVPVKKSCYGLKLTFTCNAPYGFSPVTSKRFAINSGDVSGEFLNNTVEFTRMIPPTIILRAGSNSTFTGNTLVLTNQRDGNKSMTLLLKDGYHKIVIDCKTKVAIGYRMDNAVEVEDVLTLSDLGVHLFQFISDDTMSFQLIDTYDIYWLSLLSGTNVLHFVTDNFVDPYSVEIQTRYIVEAGGF